MGCHAQDGLYIEYQYVHQKPFLEPINLQEVFASPSRHEESEQGFNKSPVALAPERSRMVIKLPTL